jgi:hypothetical protein
MTVVLWLNGGLCRLAIAAHCGNGLEKNALKKKIEGSR